MSALCRRAAVSSRSFQVRGVTAGMAVVPQVQPVLRTLFTRANRVDSFTELSVEVSPPGFGCSVTVSSFRQEYNTMLNNSTYRENFIVFIKERFQSPLNNNRSTLTDTR